MAGSSSTATTFCIDTPVLAEAMEKILREGNFADFHFLFNEDGVQKRIPAHKVILAATSDVFATMLNGQWKEKSEVEIEDASSAAFKEFLQFLYLPKVEITLENVCEVVYLAGKYNVSKCMTLCAQLIKDHLTSDNVCTGLDLSLQHDLSELKDFCLAKISEDLNEILETDGFLHCSKDLLKTILAMDDIICCDEIEIFEACLKWAKHVCKTKKKDPSAMANVRNELGDCLYQIRFGAMKPEELADCVTNNEELFTKSEVTDLLLTIGSNRSRAKIFKNIAARGKQWNDDKVLRCDLQPDALALAKNYLSRLDLSRLESTTFQINKPLLFGQIWICGIYNSISDSDSDSDEDSDDVKANLSIFEIVSNRQQTKVLQETVQLKLISPQCLKLEKPIRLQANTEYEICIETENHSSLYYYYSPNQQKNFSGGIVLHTKNNCSNFIRSLVFNK